MKMIPKLSTKAKIDGRRCPIARQRSAEVPIAVVAGIRTSMMSRVSAMANTPSQKVSSREFEWSANSPPRGVRDLTVTSPAQSRWRSQHARRSVMKMKAYESFEDYLADQKPKNQTIIRALRKFVKRVEPDLAETVKWGNGCWVGKKGPVAYVYSDAGFVQFGFFRGSTLTDRL